MTTGAGHADPYFFTWSAQRAGKPLRLRGGKGARFFTEGPSGEDETWLDLASLVYQVNAGHGEARIIDAIRDQASRLCVSHPAADFPEKRALAEKLLSLAPPGFSRVFFTLGGSDANENALKIARLFTGRFKAIARYRSYHGATMGAVSLSGDYRRPPVEPGLPGIVHVLDFDGSDPVTSRIPATMAHEGNVGAVFVESVVGHNGVLIPPPGYMRALRDACDAHGALLVCDEVLTGFGRTGKWFALEHFDGVVPDMITLGKAITSGYGTLGAVLVSDRIASHFEDEVLYAGLTHYAHPLGIAAANAAIAVYEQDGLIERAEALGALLSAGVEEIQSRQPEVTAVRSIGLLAALELGPRVDIVKLRERLAARKVFPLVNPRLPGLILAPPLCISEEELAFGLSSVAEALSGA